MKLPNPARCGNLVAKTGLGSLVAVGSITGYLDASTVLTGHPVDLVNVEPVAAAVPPSQ